METGPSGPDKSLREYIEPIKQKIEEYFRNLFGKRKKVDNHEGNQEDSPQNIPGFPGNTGNSGKEKNKGQVSPQSRNEIPVQDQDTYIPKDMEFGETEGESSRFAVVYPFLRGKYSTGKLSYFLPSTNLWSKKRQLQPLNHSLEEGKQRYTYAGFIVPGVNAIPLPTGALPDTATLVVKGRSFPVFSIDQNGCVYLSSSEKMWISFEFGLREIENTKNPIVEDNETMIFSSLSKETKILLEKLKLEGITMKSVGEIERYIKLQKKYSTKVQGTLRNKSNHRNYIKNLDESEILECYSANTLFVALCRYLGFSARLVTGFAVNNKSKKGEGLLSSNNGHAWSEVWDEVQGKWIEFDATPVKKKDGEDSNQNMGENDRDNNQENDSDGQGGENSSSESESSGESSSESSDSSQDSNSSENNHSDKQKQQSGDSQKSNKSPSELLDEMMDLAKKEDFEKNKDKLEETKKKIEEAKSKEEVRDILDNADLGDFSQEEANQAGNEKILDEEKKNLENVDNENQLDKALQNSLLDEEYKRKLEEYVDELRKKIQEQKRRMQKEMERLGFTQEELKYYKEYKQLEKEVEPDVRRQIKELQKILPANYQYKDDETQRYRSGYDLDSTKLVDYHVTGNANIFIRQEEVREQNEINMFETILIDTSGSMGSFGSEGSILRESIKAAITRAKVLEHFKVDFSIVLFGDTIREVMSFGEKFSSKGRCLIPSKLMRAAYQGGGNSQEPMSYVYDTMLKMLKKKKGKSFGNISFIGDGDLYQGNQVPQLKAKIDDLKQRGFGVTAYYINAGRTPLLGYYFGEKDGEEVVYARGCQELSKNIIESHRKHLKRKIGKYLK